MRNLTSSLHDDADDVLPGLFQEAAFDLSLWPTALTAMSDRGGGAGAVLLSTTERVPLQYSPQLGEALDVYRRDNWDVRDERCRGLPTMLRSGIATEADFIDADEIQRSPYYREFLERFGLRWFAGLGFSLGGATYCIAVQRRIEQNPFEPEATRRLARLLVPIHESMTIAQKLAGIHTTGLLQTLEDVTQPALVCSARGAVVAMNDLAERLFSAFVDPMSRHLRLGDVQSQTNLEALLKAVLKGKDRRPSDTVATIRDARGFAHQVRAVALDRWIAAFDSEARVLLLLPPCTTAPDARAILRQTFGLTPAEAVFASDLAAGHSLLGIAERVGVTYETARSRLKIIFRKTGTHRQAELVALLGKLR